MLLHKLAVLVASTAAASSFSAHHAAIRDHQGSRDNMFRGDVETSSTALEVKRDSLVPRAYVASRRKHLRGGGLDDPVDAAALMTRVSKPLLASLQEDATAATTEYKDGRAMLVMVAVLYGTLNVSLRLVYGLADPPSASALSTTRGWMAAACFLPPLLMGNNNKEISVSVDTADDEQTATRPMWQAALELALWNFAAQGLLNLGLLSTGSARASFLTQTSVVMTPVLSIVAGQSVSPLVWVGCAVALAGLVLLSSGGGAATGGMMDLALGTGDLLVLGGALSWSFYIFRLSKIGGAFDEIKLQASKTTFLAVCYTLWFVASAITSGGGSLWAGWASPLALGLLLYSALGPGTVADVLQQTGQSKVSATEANVILSLEPVFSAVFARLLLGEVTGTQENIGGLLILVAALIATRKDERD